MSGFSRRKCLAGLGAGLLSGTAMARSLSSNVALMGKPPVVISGPSMVTSVSDRSGTITYNFSAPALAGQYATGDPWALGAVVSSTTPASAQISGSYDDGQTYTGRWTNGMMVNPGRDGGTGSNPTTTPQGWDSLLKSPLVTSVTELAYSDAINLAPEKTGTPISGPATLVKTVSKLGAVDAASRNKITTMSFLTLVSAAPAAGAFRRWPGNVDKTPVFNISDIDLSVLPSIAQPGGSTVPTLAIMLAKLGPFQTFMNQMLFTRGINADLQQGLYGGDIANQVNEAMLFTMTAGVSSSERLTVVKLLVQAGLDIVDASEYGRRWSSPSFSFGGAHQWLKTLVVYTARILRNAAASPAKTALNNWADATQRKYFADDMMFYYVARKDIESEGTESILSRLFPQGFRNAHENGVEWSGKPSSQTYPSPAFQIAYRSINSYPLMTSALIARLIGAETLWGNPVFFEYCDRFYNWWRGFGSPTDTWFTAYSRAMVIAYYESYAPAYQSGAAALTVTRAASRDQEVWIETSGTLDCRYTPAASAFTVTVDGVPSTLVDLAKTGTAALSTGSTNVSKPVMTVTNATDIRIGMRVIHANLPLDTYVVSVSGTTIGLSNWVSPAFTNQAVTFSPVALTQKSVAISLPIALTAGQVVTIAYVPPGSNFARNLHGDALPAIVTMSAPNHTGELPTAVGSIDSVYSSATQNLRQWSGSAAPKSEASRTKMRGSLRFLLKSKTTNDIIMCAGINGTGNFKLYFPTAADLRLPLGTSTVSSIRMPGAGTALPLDKIITMHFIIDMTQTTYAAMFRFFFVWDTGSHTPSLTGTSGPLTGTATFDPATIFSQGMFLGNGGTVQSTAFDGGLRELTIGWGDNTLALPADYSGAAFAPNANWGGNGESVWGINQRYYAGSVAEWNGGVINRGNGGPYPMLPKLIDADTEDLKTPYVVYV